MRALAIAFASVVMATVLCGCGFHLQSEWADVQLTNDLPYSVQVQLCRKDDCSKMTGLFAFEDQYLDSFSMKARASTSDLDVKYGFVAVYRVARASDGRELGCLPFASPEPGPPLVAKVSQRVPCTGGYDKDARWPRR